ncbi:hypothetical protein ACFSNO_20085 [Streptomyces cirratus]
MGEGGGAERLAHLVLARAQQRREDGVGLPLLGQAVAAQRAEDAVGAQLQEGAYAAVGGQPGEGV